jgi:elongation factor Ts
MHVRQPEGQVGSYIHHDGRLGAMVEVKCDTPITARTREFRVLVKHLAEHVAATAPATVDDLLREGWVRDPGTTIADLVATTSDTLGETLEIRRFVRFYARDVGELISDGAGA